MKDGLPGAFGICPEKSRSAAMNVQNFRVHVRIPGLPNEKLEKAYAFVEKCVVAQTLCAANPVELKIEL